MIQAFASDPEEHLNRNLTKPTCTHSIAGVSRSQVSTLLARGGLELSTAAGVRLFASFVSATGLPSVHPIGLNNSAANNHAGAATQKSDNCGQPSRKSVREARLW